jgi:hypothetical protein
MDNNNNPEQLVDLEDLGGNLAGGNDAQQQ